MRTAGQRAAASVGVIVSTASRWIRADSSAPGTTVPVSGPAITRPDSTNSRRPLATSSSRHAS
ncbi:hypothetical protein EBR04_03780 [bacterium]|nr:hypothetical protein [bacterium]